MAKLDMAPTKSNYLRVKRELETATEGFEMLEQKRQILALELMRYVARAKSIQKEVDERAAAAFAALRRAVINDGQISLGREATAVPVQQQLQVFTRPLMGLNLPVVRADLQEPSLCFSFGQGTVASDEVVKLFTEVLKAVTQLAEVENAVFRLARELKKTQRRVNALEKIFIPNYEETERYIVDTLEEREREGFVIMRMIKHRRANA